MPTFASRTPQYGCYANWKAMQEECDRYGIMKRATARLIPENPDSEPGRRRTTHSERVGGANATLPRAGNNS